MGAVNAFDLLLKTGGLQPRVPQPSTALVAARDAVSRLIARWDEQEADQIAADNLFLDRSKERRRAEFENLRSQLGACSHDGKFDFVENALRGQWTMTCARGKVHASITLAPTVPPRVQYLEVTRTDVSSGQPQLAACPQ